MPFQHRAGADAENRALRQRALEHATNGGAGRLGDVEKGDRSRTHPSQPAGGEAHALRPARHHRERGAASGLMRDRHGPAVRQRRFEVSALEQREIVQKAGVIRLAAQAPARGAFLVQELGGGGADRRQAEQFRHAHAEIDVVEAQRKAFGKAAGRIEHGAPHG